MTMHSLWLLILLVSALSISAENCRDLSGKWFNNLGSEMILTHSEDGLLYGEYRTAVEREQGSAGSTHSIVIGAAPYDTPSATFGMSVMWRNGSSTTAWTGQCLVCEGGNETLVTSWLLRSTVDTCLDKWKSTMIGRDFFTREDLVMGPRKDEDTHTPSDGYKPPSYGGETSGGSTVVKRDTEGNGKQMCKLDGFWYNQQGSQIHLEHKEDGTLIGEYRTAVETEEGAAGSSHSMIYGISNPFESGKTWAMFVVWRNGASITGWVGQCHVCGSNSVEVLETGWLLRSQADHCRDSWKSTLYGESSFTRERQTVTGIHTPGEDGEDAKDTVSSTNPCNDALRLNSMFVSAMLALSFVQYV